MHAVREVGASDRIRYLGGTLPRRARRVLSRGAAAAQSGSGAACRERVSRERQVRAGAQSVRSRAVCQSRCICRSSLSLPLPRARAALFSPFFLSLSPLPPPPPPSRVQSFPSAGGSRAFCRARPSSRAPLESGGAERSAASAFAADYVVGWCTASNTTDAMLTVRALT